MKKSTNKDIALTTALSFSLIFSGCQLIPGGSTTSPQPTSASSTSPNIVQSKPTVSTSTQIGSVTTAKCEPISTKSLGFSALAEQQPDRCEAILRDGVYDSLKKSSQTDIETIDDSNKETSYQSALVDNLCKSDFSKSYDKSGGSAGGGWGPFSAEGSYESEQLRETQSSYCKNYSSNLSKEDKVKIYKSMSSSDSKFLDQRTASPTIANAWLECVKGTPSSLPAGLESSISENGDQVTLTVNWKPGSTMIGQVRILNLSVKGVTYDKLIFEPCTTISLAKLTQVLTRGNDPVSIVINTEAGPIIHSLPAKLGKPTITLLSDSITLNINQSNKITASVNYPDGKKDDDVKWKVNDPSIATVTEGGIITGLKAGTTSAIVSSAKDLTVQNFINIIIKDTTNLPPENTDKIAFAKSDGIYIVNGDGSNKQKISDSGEYPSISKNQKKIVFMKNSGLATMDIEGKNLAHATSGFYDIYPTISPEATMIAFSRRTGNNQTDQIWTANAINGGNLTQLTTEPKDKGKGFASWSPDGSKMIFVVNESNIYIDRPGTFNFYIINSDGTGLKKLTNFTQESSDGNGISWITWSPDGSKIAFRYYTGASTKMRVSLINADGTGLKNLTESSDSYNYPLKWSSDGKKIYFGSNRDKQNAMYEIGVDGSNIKKITDM